MLLVTSDPYRVAELWRKQGVTIGHKTCIYHDVVLSDGGECVSIGQNCVLTGCVILTHDASTNKLLGLKYGEPSLVQPVVIEDDCFIGYRSIILMGVRVGKGSIVGAGAVVTRDVPPNTVVGGNPARVICSVDELTKKRVQQIKLNPEMFPAGLEKLRINQNDTERS
jgi:maltose O-acetyltransferase